MSETWANTAMSVTDTIGHAANIALRLGSDALPIIQFVAGFIPGAAPAVQVLAVALPIIAKIAAGAPIARQALAAGAPVIDALQKHSPDIVAHLKELYAVAVNADPARPETDLTGADIPHSTLAEWSVFQANFFTPQDPRFDRMSAANA